jgi:L-cysteine:1D-myo-inositol 2-amino-2-deoxy-alpha-D-glucopyranoside ligase
MELTSTDTGERRRFEAVDGRVGVYVCGVTPYDTTHVGHLFTFASFDVLIRYLRFLGNSVTYVQNVTDVDDDMMRKAQELGTTWDALADDQVGQLVADMQALNLAMPDHFPRASEQIGGILTMVGTLVQRGRAYAANGSVYYDVRADAEFGPPSDLPDYAAMLEVANERGNTPGDPNKRDPLDFVLWQPSAPGEPWWESPWGPGRPGWHIECSAMSYRYLGPTVDIHGGGDDLVFPHHACERVQSERYTGIKPFVRFWLHAGMVRLAGEKMSKSLGNLVLARNLLQEHAPNAIRLALANHHYREAWNWEAADLPAMQEWDRIFAQALLPRPNGSTPLPELPALRQQALDAFDDDLNTPAAIQRLLDLARAIQAAAAGTAVADAQQVLCDLTGILGLKSARFS